jgi:hypothetical protein
MLKDGTMYQDLASGYLTVAFLSPLGGVFLPVALRTFRQKFPSVEVTNTEMVPGKQVKAPLEGQIDVGFLARCEARFENELALEAVGEIGLVAALPPEHALTTLRKVPLRNLANEKLVVLKESLAPATHDWIRDLCRANGFEPKLCGSATQNCCGFGEPPGDARDHRIMGVNVSGGGANAPIDGEGAASGGGGGAAAVVGRLRFFGGAGGFDGVAGCKAANTGLGSNCVAVPDDPNSPDSPDRGRTGTVCGR